MNPYTATYSPDDNKLRLYSIGRIAEEDFKRLRDAGFIWAPQQELMVAPAWSPEREDLLLELADEISDEDTSLVDRAEQRAARFDDYSVKRSRESASCRNAAMAIASNIPMGQPILVGHHSEGRARRDAERIHNGMIKSVRLWETSGYWTERAKGALAHAKYKELPAVRFRRIKAIEASKRKNAKERAQIIQELEKWTAVSVINNLRPESDEARELALDTAANAWQGRVLIPKELNRSRSSRDSIYEALRWTDDPVTVAQCCAWAEEALAKWKNPEHRSYRWDKHYDNRLAYEKAMLAESGGIASDRWNIEIGGQVLAHGEWLTVVRINRSSGRINSVSTASKPVHYWTNKIKIESVKDYRDATEETKAKAMKAKKLPPFVNIREEGTSDMLKADYDKYSEWGIAATETIEATATHGAYRQRNIIRGGSFKAVFITDMDVIEKPAP